MLTLGVALIPGVSQAQGIDFFHGSMAEAQAKAKAEGKLLFVDAYATWCGPCRWMASNVFTDAKVGDFFNKNFINVKLDCEKGEGPDFARSYGIRAYPTLFIIGADGKVVKKTMGAKQAEDLIGFGKQAI